VIQVLIRLRAKGEKWWVEVHSSQEGPVDSEVPPLHDGDLANISALPQSCRTWSSVLRCLSPDPAFMLTLPLQKQIGGIIFQRLLGNSAVRRLLDRVEQIGRQEHRAIQYLLLVEEDPLHPQLASLPLELAYDSEQGQFFFKNPDRPVFRCAHSADAQDLVLNSGTRVLIVTAHVEGSEPTANHLNDHAEKLVQSVRRSQFVADVLEHATPEALERRLLEGDPIDVLYIAGHGVADADHCGSVRLRGGALTGQRLGTWLETARQRGRPVSVVLLCACSSAVVGTEAGTAGMAQWLAGRRRAQAALGFRGPVKVEWALQFFERMFAALSEPMNLESAYAKARLDADDSDTQWALPLLFSRPTDLWKAARRDGNHLGLQPLAVDAIRQLTEERDEDLRAAGELMVAQKYDEARGRYEKAVLKLDELVRRTPGEQSINRLLARARLGFALTLLVLQESSERIAEMLGALAPELLVARSTALLAQAWASIDELERAESTLALISADDEADPQVEVARQLIALRRGTIPDPLLHEPTVLLTAAYCHAQKGRLPDAARCASLLLESVPQDGLFCFFATDLLTRILRNSVYEDPSTRDYVPRDQWPSVLQSVLEGHRRIESLPLPAKLHEAREETRSLLSDLLRDADAQVSARIRRESPAQILVRQGKLDDALATVSDSKHPWFPAIERASLCMLAHEPRRALEQLQAIERTHPGKQPLEHLMASVLMALGQPEEALPFADRAHTVLPSGGHRLLLAECLLACNRHEAAIRAGQLLADCEQREHWRELKARATAAEHTDLNLAARLWDRYLALRSDDCQCRLHSAAMRHLLGERNNAADYAWRAFKTARAHGLSPQQLGTVAEFVRGSSDLSSTEQQERLQQIVDRLLGDFPDVPEAQHEALCITISMQDRSVIGKIRFDLLERHGLVYVGKSVDELTAVLEQHRQHQQGVAWFYKAGLWPYEALSIEAAQLAQQAFAGRTAREPLLSTPIGSPLTILPALSSVQLLTGQLELFLLERLNLLPRLKRALQAGGRLILFSDTVEGINGTFNQLTSEIRQADERDSLNRPEDAASLQALRDLARRAQEVYRFVAEGLRDRWIESGLERPTIDLPMQGDGADIFQTTWQRTLGYRAALVGQPKRFLLSADFLTCALFGGGDFVRLWLQFLRPEPDAFQRHVHELLPTTQRIVTLPLLVRRLIDEESELQRQLRLLAELGFADALGPADLLREARDASLLARIERIAWLPHEAPSNNVISRQGEQETIHPGHHAAMIHITQLYAAAIMQAVCSPAQAGASVEDADTVLCTLLDRVAAMPGPALELACIALADEVTPRIGHAVVLDETAERQSVSTNSPIGQFWTAIWRWAGTDERRHAAISWAVSTKLAHVDQCLGARSPRMFDVGTLLLGAMEGHASQTVAILSANWDIKPLEVQRLPPSPGNAGEENWESIFRQAVVALGRGEVFVADRSSATWDIQITHGTNGRVYALPAEGVLLRAGSETIARLAPHLALHHSDRDGRAYSRLTELAARPTDQECRRSVARLAVQAPWRVMRASPLSLARWPALTKLSGVLLPSDVQELRAVLCEPGPLEHDPSLALLLERTQSEPPWSAWPGLVEQASLVPGPLSVFGLGAIFRSAFHATRVQASLERLSQPGEHPAAQIGQDLIYLCTTAIQRPLLRLSESEVVDVRKELPRLMAQALHDALARERRDAQDEHAVLAENEPGLLRLCARVVSAIAWPVPLPMRDGLWLSYRLYQWYMAQFLTLEPDVRALALRELALAYPTPISASDVPRDLLHPLRLGPDGTSYRLLALLYAIAVGPLLGQRVKMDEEATPSTADPLAAGTTSTELEVLLAEIAARPLSRAEQQVKLQAMTQAPSMLGWSQAEPATTPELALLALLSRRQQAFAELPLPTRLEWLRRLPQRERDADAVSQNLIALLLEAASLGAPNLHPEERILLRERSGLLRSHVADWFSPESQQSLLAAAWLCRIRLYEAGEMDLVDELRVLFRDAQRKELAHVLFVHYLVALAEVAIDDLAVEFKEIVDLARSSAEDTRPWVQALEQLAHSSKPEAQRLAQRLLAEMAIR